MAESRTQRTDDHVSISLADYNALSAKAGDKDDPIVL